MFSGRLGAVLPPPRDLIELMRVVIAVTSYPLADHGGKGGGGSGSGGGGSGSGPSGKGDKKKPKKSGKLGRAGKGIKGVAAAGAPTWRTCDPDAVVKTAKVMLNSGHFAALLGAVPVRAFTDDQVTENHQFIVPTPCVCGRCLQISHRGSRHPPLNPVDPC